MTSSRHWSMSKKRPRVIPPAVTQAESTASVNDSGELVIRINRRLTNHNSRNRHPHWSVKHRERDAWRTLLLEVVLRAKLQAWLVTDETPDADAWRLVLIRREVSSRRSFVRDTFDNLPWCTKELRDAMKAVGLIRDDSERWSDMEIEQAVSEDGRDWTQIRIGTGGWHG